MIYFKDRGLQIGWSTVFMAEYAGPLAVYLWIYTRPWLFYGEVPADVGYKLAARQELSILKYTIQVNILKKSLGTLKL